MDAERCRCGHEGGEPHPCHGHSYACRKPATAHFYEPVKLYSLAGAQTKASVTQTWACAECWAEFLALIGAAKEE